jgi:hypothetical protein
VAVADLRRNSYSVPYSHLARHQHSVRVSLVSARRIRRRSGLLGARVSVAILITASIVVVVLGILLFVGFRWVKPESLRLKVWNWLEFEMRGQDEPEPPKRAIKRS